MKRGFSLVELSIVLVILGLLTGGILAGQSLIRASELRSITTQRERVISSAFAFRDKYLALPGDLSSGTKFWPRMTNTADCLTNSAAAVNATTGTCDGNGDGMIDALGAASESSESFQFWRQLAFTGLIEGTYTGIAGAGGNNHSIAGTNVLGSKIGKAGWTVVYTASISGNTRFFDGTFNSNTFRFGATSGASSMVIEVIKPEEAWNIDIKIDDGKPAYGHTWAINWDTCTDAANSAAVTANYLLTDNTIACGLFFTKIF